jgi:EAL domain-containing protein (putative c-di-GMP-specific phosphodiesterase class I)
MHIQALKRLELGKDLRQSIQGGDFGVAYQPKVLLDAGRIVEAEALVRWHIPERGTVMPLEFIPVAEETGLIISIGEQVLENACRQIREWHEQYERLLDLKMYEPLG